jgi:protein-S-isoprenylcysteine O-methyltransferase Ste14
MDYDIFFRNIMLASFMIFMPCAAYFRVRSKTSEKLDRWQEGWFLLFGIRLIALTHMVGMVSFLIDPAHMSWSSVVIPLWMRWIGVGFGFFAGFLWIYTFIHLGKNLTDTVVTRKNAELVTSGPYRFVRHPFYGALVCANIANGLTAANWYLFITGMIVWFLLIKRTDIEEQNLIKKFGDDYKKYMQRVGRFFPKVYK